MKHLQTVAVAFCITFTAVSSMLAQGIQPYPNAITDRLVHDKTPMLPPPVGVVFADPDFGSSMLRVTDPNTDPSRAGSYFRNPNDMGNGWSADGTKFYVIRQGGANLAFAFNPATMTVNSLPGAGPGSGLAIPLRTGPTFSFADSDLLYGTLRESPLTIATYRLSSGTTSSLFDTRECATQPALGSHVFSDDVTISTDDRRIVISEGGKEFGAHMFVTVYDKQLGCRWYNTETGEIGGQWGALGQASTLNRFLISHSSISGSGRFVKIQVNYFGFYLWDLATLTVTACPVQSSLDCGQYAALGDNTYVNAAGKVDEMNTLKRPLGNLADITQLVYPLPLPHYWGMLKRFTWSNGHLNDNAPVCGTTYSYDGDTSVTQPYDTEIFCIETNGLRSTIWRFAHNRSVWNWGFFYTAPFPSISLDGRFLMFTSSWDGEVGMTPAGEPRTDVWIVKLD